MASWHLNWNSSQEDLLKECANHLHLGQWQLFRCTLTTLLSDRYGGHDVNIKRRMCRLLKSIYHSPHTYCHGSSRLPNPFDVFWCCAQVYHDITDDKEDATLVLRDAAFRDLLCRMLPVSSPDFVKELYAIHARPSDETSLQLSAQFCRSFKELMKLRPDLGRAAWQHLIKVDDEEGHDVQLLQILYDSIDYELSLLEMRREQTGWEPCPAAVDSSSLRLLLQVGDCLTRPRKSNGETTSVEEFERQVHCLVCRLWHLCERDVSTKHLILDSLVCQPQMTLLKMFHAVDNRMLNIVEHHGTGRSAENFLQLLNGGHRTNGIKELFLYAVINKVHFLETLVTSSVDLLHSGELLLVQSALSHPAVCCLKPLVFLLAWSKARNVSDAIRLLDAHQVLFRNEQEECDPHLREACQQLVQKAKLVFRAMESPSARRSLKTARTVADIMSSLQQHSALEILHRCHRLNAMDRTRALEELCSCTVPSLPEEETRDGAVLSAFYVMHDLFQVIVAGRKLEQHVTELSRRHRKSSVDRCDVSMASELRAQYEEQVVRALDKIQHAIAVFHPLNYRVEVLENAFSLLFLTHDDLDERQSSSSEDEDEDGLRRSFRRKKSSTRASTDSDCAKAHPRRTSSGNASSRSESSSSHLTNTGFLLSACVVRDVLDCLQRCTSDLSLSLHGHKEVVVAGAAVPPCSIANKATVQRASRLSQCISESLWRLQLVTDDAFYKNVGTFPVEELVDERCANDRLAWNFYGDCHDDDDSDEANGDQGTKRQSTVRLSATVSVVSRMLSQHVSLLNACLWQNDLVKASQVVRMLGMESTPLATEVNFATHYKEAVQRLSQHRPAGRLQKSGGGRQSAWGNIVEAARAGADAAETLVADELLALHKVPSVPGDSAGQFGQWLPCPIDWRALARADLALVACSRVPACRSLLEASRSALAGETGSRSHPYNKHARAAASPPTRGILGFLQDVSSLVAADTVPLRTEEADMTIETKTCLRSCLLNGMWPLSGVEQKEHTETWRLLFDTLQKLQQRLSLSEAPARRPLQPASSTESSSSASSASASQRPSESKQISIAAMCHKLKKICLVHSCRWEDDTLLAVPRKRLQGDEVKAPAYLGTLVEYAKRISCILPLVFADSPSSHDGNPFAVFQHSPASLLKYLLTGDNVPLSELENYAKYLGVNLLHAIVGEYCPRIPVVFQEHYGLPADSEPDVPRLPHSLLRYTQEHCWLAAVLIQALGCSNALPSEGDVLECAVVLYPVLHRFLEHRGSTPSGKSSAELALTPAPSSHHIKSTFDVLVSRGDFARALEYLESWECQSPHSRQVAWPLRDLVLSQLALDSVARPDLRPPWHYVLLVRDPMKRAGLVLEHFRSWTGTTGTLMALDACINDAATGEDLRRDFRHQRQKVQLYSSICDRIAEGKIAWPKETKATSWQTIANLSSSDPHKILELLFASKCYSFVLEWSRLHGVPEGSKRMVDDSCFLLSFESSSYDRVVIQRMLERINDPERRFFYYQRLFHHSRDLSSAEALVLKLMTDDEAHSAASPDTAINHKIGAKILLCIAESKRPEYLELVPQPHFMLEQMLINMKMEPLEKAFQVIRDDVKSLHDASPVSCASLNKILEVYAHKAMDFRVVQTVAVEERSNERTAASSISKDRHPFIMPLRVPLKDQWIPDASVTVCMVCLVEQFSMFNRRHHCRRCGRVACASCSQLRMIVEDYGDLLVRVCDDCHEQSATRAAESPQSLEGRLKARFRGMSPDDSRELSPRLCRATSSDSERSRQFIWKLSTDALHNITTREEFSYEQAPNISLCLSILDLHWDQHRSGLYLLDLADNMFHLLQPIEPGKPNPEIDYNLVISMTKSVLLSAKVKFSKSCDSEGVSRCDVLLSLADLLKTLVASNCKHLIPVGDLTQNDVVRRLRDRLIQEERWALAVDISTKGGLDVIGVWAAWGMACLRIGHFALAREKLSSSLQRLQDQSKLKQMESLLKEILNQLYSHKMPVDGKASLIAASLQRLRSIREGTIQEGRRGCVSSRLDPVVDEECLFYIRSFGTSATHLAFYARFGFWAEALRRTLETKCIAATFVEEVAMAAVRKGQFHKLLSEMRSTYSSLKKWSPYLGPLCRHLERHGHMHSLYDLQLFVKDYVRAAITCIIFYSRDARDYDELYDRLHYLASSKQHLELYNQHMNASSAIVSKHSLAMSMSVKEVHRYLRTIAIQVEVTHFLHGKANVTRYLFSSDADLSDASSIYGGGGSSQFAVAHLAGNIPTVFDSAKTRAHLASSVIMAGSTPAEGFSLASRIIREFKLHAEKVYGLVARKLVLFDRVQDLQSFVSCMASSSTGLAGEMCDNALLNAVSAALSSGAEGYVDSIIKLLKTEQVKIEALMMSGRLKSAYLMAVKQDCVETVQRILNEAIRIGQPSVKIICEKWLSLKQKSV